MALENFNSQEDVEVRPKLNAIVDWINDQIALGANPFGAALSDLVDTTITSAAFNDFLRYTGTAWVNDSLITTALGPPTGGSYTIGQLSRDDAGALFECTDATYETWEQLTAGELDADPVDGDFHTGAIFSEYLYYNRTTRKYKAYVSSAWVNIVGFVLDADTGTAEDVSDGDTVTIVGDAQTVETAVSATNTVVVREIVTVALGPPDGGGFAVGDLSRDLSGALFRCTDATYDTWEQLTEGSLDADPVAGDFHTSSLFVGYRFVDRDTGQRRLEASGVFGDI